MSIARVRSFAFSGIDAVPVEVQVQVAGGLPAFLIVGLPDKTVGEARERVRAALTTMGLALPPKRVLINLAPASLLKEGSHFDLAIALCLLVAMDVLPREEIGGYAALGELSLDGSLLPVPGVLPAAMSASELDLGLICPLSQGGEATWWRNIIKLVTGASSFAANLYLCSLKVLKDLVTMDSWCLKTELNLIIRSVTRLSIQVVRIIPSRSSIYL